MLQFFLSPVSPKGKNINLTTAFFINQTANLNKYTSKQKLIFIFLNQKQGLQNILKKEKIELVNLKTQKLGDKIFCRIKN